MASDWRQRQKKELRQQLYQAAVELFESNGYDSTTVQQITEQVGVAKGTFFNHFPSKEHVLGEWYDGITDKSLQTAVSATAPTAEEAVCALFVDMAMQATAYPELLRAKARNSANALLLEAEQVQVDEINTFLLAQCQAGKERGELEPGLDSEFFVGLLGAVLTGTSRAWVRTHPQFDFPAVIRQRTRFLFRAAKLQNGTQSG